MNFFVHLNSICQHFLSSWISFSSHQCLRVSVRVRLCGHDDRLWFMWHICVVCSIPLLCNTSGRVIIKIIRVFYEKFPNFSPDWNFTVMLRIEQNQPSHIVYRTIHDMRSWSRREISRVYFYSQCERHYNVGWGVISLVRSYPDGFIDIKYLCTLRPKFEIFLL